MKRSYILLILLTLFVFPQIGQTQWAAAPQIVIGFPTSDFANVSGTGGGFGVKIIRNLGGLSGGFGLRGDFSFLNYGREIDTIRDSFGRAFLAEVRNESFRLTFGPQYTAGTGNFKVYGGVLAGFYIFRTNINVNTSFGFFSGERDSDAAVGWKFGGGILYDVGLGPWLDIGVEYQTIYNITTEFEVTDDTGQNVTVRRDITANEFTLKIGIIFFLGR